MDGGPQNRIGSCGAVAALGSVVDVSTAPLDVDTDVYASASALFLRENDTVCDLVAAAVSAAGEGGGMAGTDSGGVDWATRYDAAAAASVAAGATLVDGLGHLGELLDRSGANHAGAEASSGGPPAYPGEGAGPGAVSITPATPPSANGTGDDPPTGWFLVAHLLQYAWPNGHQDRLRSVARGWSDAARGLREAADRLTRPIGDVSALRSPEVDAAVGTCCEVQQSTRSLADSFDALAAACSDYADGLDEAHSSIVDELTEFAAETVLIQLLAAAAAGVTAGGSEVVGQSGQAARTALAAERIDRFLQKLVDLVQTLTGSVKLVEAQSGLVLSNIERDILAKGATRAVEAVARAVPRVDLRAAENAGGHTIARHVAKPDGYLIERCRKGLPEASTFTDLASAENAISSNLAAHQGEIQSWLAGADDTLALRTSVAASAGRIYVAESKSFVSPSQVRTVLARDGHGGYFILTSYLEV